MRRKTVVYSKIDPIELALGIGANSVLPRNPRGWEMIFKNPLRKTRFGLTPTGPLFPFFCLEGFDLTKSKVLLKPNYEITRRGELFFFKSGDLEILVYDKWLVSLRNLATGEVIYSESKSA